MHDDPFSTIDDTQLGSITGGGLFGAIRKGWNATRGVRETVGSAANNGRLAVGNWIDTAGRSAAQNLGRAIPWGAGGAGAGAGAEYARGQGE